MATVGPRSVLVARSSSLAPGAIAGAVIGSVVGVLLIALCIFPFVVRARRRRLTHNDEPTLAEMGQGPGGPLFAQHQDPDDDSTNKYSKDNLVPSDADNHHHQQHHHPPHPGPNNADVNGQTPSPKQPVPQGVTAGQGLPSPVSPPHSPAAGPDSPTSQAHGDGQAASTAAAGPLRSATKGTVGKDSNRELSLTESYGSPSRQLTGITFTAGITEEPESFLTTSDSRRSTLAGSIKNFLFKRGSSGPGRKDSKRSNLGSTEGATRSPTQNTFDISQPVFAEPPLESNPNAPGLAWDYYHDPTLGLETTHTPQNAFGTQTGLTIVPPTNADFSAPLSPASPVGQQQPFTSNGLPSHMTKEELDALSPASDKTVTPKDPVRTFSLRNRLPGPLQRVDSLPPPTIVSDIPSPPLQHTAGPSGNPMMMMNPTNAVEASWMTKQELLQIQNSPPASELHYIQTPPAPPSEPTFAGMVSSVDEVDYLSNPGLSPESLSYQSPSPYQSPYESPYQSPEQVAPEIGSIQYYGEPGEYTYSPNVQIQVQMQSVSPNYSTPPPTDLSAQGTPETGLTPYTASPSPPSDFNGVNTVHLGVSPVPSPAQSPGGTSPGVGKVFNCEICGRVFDQVHKLK